LVVGLSGLLFLALLFIEARGLAHGVFLSRSALPTQATEQDSIDMNLEIFNDGSMSIENLYIEDFFGPGVEPIWLGSLSHPLGPQESQKLGYQLKCDGGMGVFPIGPLIVRVRDSLGVFEYRVQFDRPLQIEVYPRVETIPTLPVKGYAQADQYGLYDIAAKGNSVNFVGIREFHRGDSLKHISWRITAKTQQLMVKEFERAINGYVSLCLNLNARLHIGTKALSTWELSRDIALSILRQQLELGNTVQFFSNECFVEPGRGELHLEYLAKKIMSLALVPPIIKYLQTQEQEERHLLSLCSEWIPPGSSLFYVAPYVANDFDQVINILRSFQSADIQVFCVLVDISSFYPELKNRIDWISMPQELIDGSQTKLDQKAYRLAATGIQTYIVKHGSPLSHPFGYSREMPYYEK
jgi:uncharacterized protein (DUF58 family)